MGCEAKPLNDDSRGGVVVVVGGCRFKPEQMIKQIKF